MRDSIIRMLMESIIRRADLRGEMFHISVFEASDVAEEAADDILNLIEERTTRYYEQHVVEAKLHLVTSLPTFIVGRRRVAGYTSSDDLLARLGLRRLSPERERTPAPETAPPGPQASGVYLTAEQLDQALGAGRNQPIVVGRSGAQDGIIREIGTMPPTVQDAEDGGAGRRRDGHQDGIRVAGRTRSTELNLLGQERSRGSVLGF